MDKSAVFIDGGYLMKLTKQVFVWEEGSPKTINFELFAKAFASETKTDLLRGYYYICPPYQSYNPTAIEAAKLRSYYAFCHSLRELKQIELREGSTARIYDEFGKPHYSQKKVDVLLAMDMLRLVMKRAVQQVILVASDSDYIPAIKEVKDEGVKVHLYYYSGNHYVHSRELVNECDVTHHITEELVNSCALARRPKRALSLVVSRS
jgi:uncharacterized LabA/DUF88 family protein